MVSPSDAVDVKVTPNIQVAAGAADPPFEITQDGKTMCWCKGHNDYRLDTQFQKSSQKSQYRWCAACIRSKRVDEKKFFSDNEWHRQLHVLTGFSKDKLGSSKIGPEDLERVYEVRHAGALTRSPARACTPRPRPRHSDRRDTNRIDG